MAADRRRGRTLSIGFMIVWLVFWAAGILIVVWGLGGAVLDGNLEAAVVMAVWLTAAGLGLVAGGRRLRQMLRNDGRPPPKGVRNHQWKDGFDDAP